MAPPRLLQELGAQRRVVEAQDERMDDGTSDPGDEHRRPHPRLGVGDGAHHQAVHALEHEPERLVLDEEAHHVAWPALVAVTLVSWWIGSSHGRGELTSKRRDHTYGVISIATIKIRVTVRKFMEVRRAPALLPRLTDGWTVFILVALLAIYSLRLSMPPV